MTRTINALLVFLMVLSAAAVYDMKYEAEMAASTVAALDQQIDNERAEISLLKAEWSVLSQPARLKQLVDRHQDILQLQPLTADQFGTIADIPEKPVEPDPDGDLLVGAPSRSADADPAAVAPALSAQATHDGDVGLDADDTGLVR
jgi:hypothetical protein